MLVDKNACNKPLTLDCQVNSNPSANITWYRRRINNNQVYQFVLDKKKLTSLFTKIDINSSPIDENTYYFDELIGTGPTYTIASFNCANLLTNLKNKRIFNFSEILHMKKSESEFGSPTQLFLFHLIHSEFE